MDEGLIPFLCEMFVFGRVDSRLAVLYLYDLPRHVSSSAFTKF